MGYKRAREFWDTLAPREFRVGEDEAFPGLNVTTDEEILDIIKRSYTNIYHGACTCSMGKWDDAMAVVDGKGCVYGIGRLRVVDASIFPILMPPGHHMATVCELPFQTVPPVPCLLTPLDAIVEEISCEITGNCREA